MTAPEDDSMVVHRWRIRVVGGEALTVECRRSELVKALIDRDGVLETPSGTLIRVAHVVSTELLV